MSLGSDHDSGFNSDDSDDPDNGFEDVSSDRPIPTAMEPEGSDQDSDFDPNDPYNPANNPDRAGTHDNSGVFALHVPPGP